MGANGTAAGYRRQRWRARSAGQALRLSLSLPAFAARVTVDRRIGRPDRGRGPVARQDRAGLRFDPGSGDAGSRRRLPHRLQEGPGGRARPGKRRGGAERPGRRARAAVGKSARCRRNRRRAALPGGRSLSAAARRAKLEDVLPKPRRRADEAARAAPASFAGLAALRDKPRRGR